MTQDPLQTSLDALIKKAVPALGAPEAVAKFKAATWKGKGVLYEGGKQSHLTAEWAIQLPFQNRVAGRIVQGEAALSAISAMNENAGWEEVNGETKAMDEKKLAENQSQFYVNWVLPMTPLDDKLFELDSLGESRIDECVVFGVNVHKSGYQDVKLYFEEATGRLARSEAQIVDEGEIILQDTFYHDFQEISGLVRPMRIEIWRNRKRFADLALSDYQPQEKLDDEVFSKS